MKDSNRLREAKKQIEIVRANRAVPNLSSVSGYLSEMIDEIEAAESNQNQ